LCSTLRWKLRIDGSSKSGLAEYDPVTGDLRTLDEVCDRIRGRSCARSVISIAALSLEETPSIDQKSLKG
jgi:hypothetical protein